MNIYHWVVGLAVNGRIHDIAQKFYNHVLKQEVVAATVTYKFSSLSYFSRRTLLEIQYNNYIIHLLYNYNIY